MISIQNKFIDFLKINDYPPFLLAGFVKLFGYNPNRRTPWEVR